MRYLFVCLLVISVALVSGCKVKEDSSAANKGEKGKVKVKANQDKVNEMSAKNWYGHEIITETTTRLSRRLVTDEGQTARIKASLTETLKAVGGDHNTIYPYEEAKELSMKLVRNAAVNFRDALDEKQKKILDQWLAE